jgi:Kunitz/Bovine pancreatic trypsin inhibitor domain
MKNLIILAISIVLTSTFACKKDCTRSQSTACNETVPTGELCQAYFQRWFYNPSTNTCTLVGYSGCSQKGFATKIECDSCLCR